jgi:hypothetical protein
MAQAPSIPQHGFSRVTQEVRRAPVAQNAPSMPQHRFVQNAPVARPMPAPQARATERPAHTVQARAVAGGSRSFGQAGRQGNGGGNGGGRHRG